jgi:hypothetical protein
MIDLMHEKKSSGVISVTRVTKQLLADVPRAGANFLVHPQVRRSQRGAQSAGCELTAGNDQ